MNSKNVYSDNIHAFSADDKQYFKDILKLVLPGLSPSFEEEILKSFEEKTKERLKELDEEFEKLKEEIEKSQGGK